MPVTSDVTFREALLRTLSNEYVVRYLAMCLVALIIAFGALWYGLMLPLIVNPEGRFSSA